MGGQDSGGSGLGGQDVTPAQASPDTDAARALGRIPLFGDLSEATLARLGAAGRRRSWTAGATLFQRGDTGDHMLAILSGRVRLSLGTAGGKELVLRHLEAPEVLGELAVLDGQPRSADAVALEPVTALVIGRDQFTAIANAQPDLGLALARHLCAMLRNTNFQMESIALYDLQMRVIRFFLFSLHQVYGEQLPDQGVLRMSFNQSDLSSVLGASRPKINQALQALIAEGAIRRDGERITCTVKRLRGLLEEGEAF